MQRNTFQAAAYPTMDDFAANIARVNGMLEVVEQELYDRQIYPTAGGNAFTFFAQPQGAGQSSESGLAAGVAKTLADTNMTQNGQLPTPQSFWLDNIQVDADPGSVSTANTYVTQAPSASATGVAAMLTGETDKWAILNAGFVQLSLGQKPYYTNGPLSYFPPRVQKRVDGAVSAGNTAATLSSQMKVVWIDGQMRTLDPGFGLQSGMNFVLSINFPALIATPSGFNARLKASLGGWLFRAAQ